MQTYSHFLMTAALKVPLQKRGITVYSGALLLGSVLPDVPFFLLTLIWGGYYLWIAPLGPEPTAMSVMEYLHFDLFYTDPVWLVGHNFFHAPLILAAIGLLGVGLSRPKPNWGRRLIWFALGAGLHTAIDILTHHSDGPLLFFPLNWEFRFASPVSYWERAYWGWLFSPLEHVLDLLLLGYFVRHWWQRRIHKEE